MGLGDIGQYIDENHIGTKPMEDDSFEHFEMPIEENKVRVVPTKKVVFNWKKALSKELMQGKHTDELLRKYGDFFKKYGVYEKALNYLNANDGVIGYFVVDSNAFDDKFTYNDIPEFMRKCNCYSINPKSMQEVFDNNLVSDNDGTLDGFLNTSEKPVSVVRYVDCASGLPVVKNVQVCYNDEDNPRLAEIAKLFLMRKLMGLADYSRFASKSGKLAFLVNCVKASLAPKSNATGNYENLAADYGVVEQKAIAESTKAQKAQEVGEVGELHVDDIGNTSMPKPMHISRRVNSSEFVEDVNVQGKKSSINVSMGEMKLDNIPVSARQKSAICDDLHEASKKDAKVDFKIAKKQSASVNEDEFFALDAADDVIEFDEKSDEFEVSSKAEWNF